MIESRDLVWASDRLRCPAKRSFVTVEPDDVYAGMYRVRRCDRTLTDFANLSRARDAAKSILLSVLNTRETATEAAPARSQAEAA